VAKKWLLGLGILCAVAAAAQAQGALREWWSNRFRQRRGAGEQSEELTIEQQRKLGLNDEQIQKIAEKRRDLEKERAKLEKQLDAARGAAAAANAEVARLGKEIRSILTVKITKVYESVMSEAQLKEQRTQAYLEQAKQQLAMYRGWLKLTDAQIDDIAQMVVPVLEKYDKMGEELEDARQRLAELRRAEKLDIKAIDKAEKQLDELSKRTTWRRQTEEFREKMRAGLMPEQLERFERFRPGMFFRGRR